MALYCLVLYCMVLLCVVFYFMVFYFIVHELKANQEVSRGNGIRPGAMLNEIG